MKPVILPIMGEEIYLEKTLYSDGTVAVILKESEPECSFDDEFGVLTVALENGANCVEEDEIIVKLWSENAPFKSLIETPFFKDTGKRIPTGYVEAHVWKIIDYSVFGE